MLECDLPLEVALPLFWQEATSAALASADQSGRHGDLEMEALSHFTWLILY